MKKAIILLFMIAFTRAGYAQPPVEPASPGNTYGKKITADGSIAASELSKRLLKKDTVDVKIAAKVLSSCPKKGCWMNVELPDKTKMFVRFKDYAFFVPTDIAGKTVILEGIAFNQTTSVGELKHYARDAQKNQAEIDAITQPRKQVRFLANGVLVQ